MCVIECLYVCDGDGVSESEKGNGVTISEPGQNASIGSYNFSCLKKERGREGQSVSARASRRGEEEENVTILYENLNF